MGGTLNTSGSFRFEATRVGRDTVLAQIVRLVQDAQGSKPHIARLADRISGVFVPVSFARDRGFRGLVRVGARAGVRTRARGVRLRAHHRLPVRARPRNADGHSGGHRPGRRERHSDPER